MKSSLTFFALVTAVAAPSAFAAELSGLNLPVALDSGSLAAAFVISVMLLTVLNDYARGTARPMRATRAVAPAKSSHPLAA